MPPPGVSPPAPAPGAPGPAGLRLEPVAGDVEGPVAEQVRRLAQAEFREDALEIVDSGSVWEAAALVDNEGALVGFVVFGVLGGLMSLRYISVIPRQRKRGCGRQLVEHVIARCRERGVEEVSLFCRRELVGFYLTLGFHEVPEEDGDSEDDLQVPMCFPVPRSGDPPGAGPPPRLEEAEEEEDEEERDEGRAEGT